MDILNISLFYTKKSIKYLANKYNFKVLKIETTGLDIARFIKVFRRDKKGDTSTSIREKNKNINENFRNISGSNRVIFVIKNIINTILSFFGKGDTLKIFCIKIDDRRE